MMGLTLLQIHAFDYLFENRARDGGLLKSDVKKTQFKTATINVLIANKLVVEISKGSNIVYAIMPRGVLFNRVKKELTYKNQQSATPRSVESTILAYARDALAVSKQYYP
jgi:hypothetical protein